MRHIMTALLILCATTAGAETPLSRMAGDWTGSGWARKTQNHPAERIRCRVSNTYDATLMQLTVEGRCAVAGRQIPMTGTLRQTDAGGQLAGDWDVPTDIGSTTVAGRVDDTSVAITLAATAPGSGQDITQVLRWTVEGEKMLLQSTLVADPTLVMSEITFQ